MTDPLSLRKFSVVFKSPTAPTRTNTDSGPSSVFKSPTAPTRTNNDSGPSSSDDSYVIITEESIQENSLPHNILTSDQQLETITIETIETDGSRSNGKN